jgi:hypothetical protein
MAMTTGPPLRSSELPEDFFGFGAVGRRRVFNIVEITAGDELSLGRHSSAPFALFSLPRHSLMTARVGRIFSAVSHVLRVRGEPKILDAVVRDVSVDVVNVEAIRDVTIEQGEDNAMSVKGAAMKRHATITTLMPTFSAQPIPSRIFWVLAPH